MLAPTIGGLQQTTNYKVVLPFYIYASVAFLVGTSLLLFHTNAVEMHYFNPFTLAVTHTMALGWGTMIILGASHQLLPVLIEGKLDSDAIAYSTFIFTAIGIPILIASFYFFHVGWIMELGALLINIGVLLYIINVLRSSFKSPSRNVHAWFIITASLWLFTTTFFGLLLVCNFSDNILPSASLNYLSLHAHLGIVGWFLLLVIGVGSRLIPLFLISKYTNNKMLWQIFWSVNSGLVLFIVVWLMGVSHVWLYLAALPVFVGMALFGIFCTKAYKVRIRRGVDEQMKTSLLSVIQMLLPFLVLLATLLILPVSDNPQMGTLYGFCIFFGWITAIILGMTFKTMPFIVWNKVYKKRARGKTPPPKDLFNEKVYNTMLIIYIAGFVIFIAGILLLNQLALQAGAAALLIAAVLYVFNTTKVFLHQPKES